MLENLPELIKQTKGAAALFKVCAQYLGWNKPEKIREEARAQADAAKIKAQGDADVKVIEAEAEAKERIIRARADLETVGLGGVVEREKERQENRQKVFMHAVKELPPGANPENIEKMDKDKLARVFRESEIVSDAEVQLFWGKILAGEAEVPGSFSKKTMSVVSNMDKKDADMFTYFCQFAAYIGALPLEISTHLDNYATMNDYVAAIIRNRYARPLVYSIEHDFYNGKYRLFDIVFGLNELIIHDNSGDFAVSHPKHPAAFLYHGELVRVNPAQGKDSGQIRTGTMIFTKVGSELFPICGAQKNEEFLPYLMQKWQKMGYNPQIIPRPKKEQ